MGYRILADENVQRQVCRLLCERGHDVEMVVDVLEPGVDDEVVLRYAHVTERVVLTADTDFIATSRPTLFQPNDRLPAFQVAEIVDEISSQIDQSELPNEVTVVDGWLKGQ